MVLTVGNTRQVVGFVVISTKRIISSSSFLLSRSSNVRNCRRQSQCFYATKQPIDIATTNLLNKQCNDTNYDKNEIVPATSNTLKEESNTLRCNNNHDVTTTTTTDTQEDIEKLVQTWRVHPDCNPIVQFKSWIVNTENASIIQTILNSKITRPYLVKNLQLIQHLQTRFRTVRDYNNNCDNTNDDNNKNNNNNNNDNKSNEKLILLHPNAPCIDELPDNVQNMLLQSNIRDGPIIEQRFHYNEFTSSYLLERILPEHVHPPPSSFETIGHVAHLNLRKHHIPYKYLIGQIILETLPNIQTVIQKRGEVTGPYRTYDIELLAGKNDTIVTVIENGISITFDMTKMYWCSRLSEERKRIIQLIQQQQQKSQQQSKKRNDNDNNTKPIIIADPFCGVGALCMQIAKKLNNVIIIANDWNPNAIDSLKDNAKKNNVLQQFYKITCSDAYDFLMELGLDTTNTDITKRKHNSRSENNNKYTVKNNKKGKQQQYQQHRLPDHVIMNYPLEAPEFLGALRWWPISNTKQQQQNPPPRIHVYTFARDDDGNGRSAEDVAIDLIANNLVVDTSNNKQQSKYRKDELNNIYGCNVDVHDVRDVAPGKRVFCVSFSVTNKLLRTMQGDFR